MSCAGQEANNEDPLSELGQEQPATEQTADAAPKDDAGLGDLTPPEEPAKADNVGLPSEDEMAKTAEAGSDLGDIPAEKASNEDLSKDSALNDVLGLPSDADIAKAAREEEMSKARTASLGEGGGQSVEQPWSGVSRLPSIPQSAIKRKGKSLNRFYFVRKGDTPASVSELLYGSAGQAKDLKAWNKGAWKPGKLLFYASAQSPTDTQMQSFYKERGIQNGEYTVKKGDWLSKVAKNLLGHPGSWKEIAIINGLSSADAIEKGQRLAVYPADLRGGAPAGGLAQNIDPTVQPTVPPAGTPDSFQADSGLQNAPPVPSGGPNKKITKKSGLDTLLILKQEWITIVFGSVVVLFLIALLIVNKRRKARRNTATEDVPDDIFGGGAQ